LGHQDRHCDQGQGQPAVKYRDLPKDQGIRIHESRAVSSVPPTPGMAEWRSQTHVGLHVPRTACPACCPPPASPRGCLGTTGIGLRASMFLSLQGGYSKAE